MTLKKQFQVTFNNTVVNENRVDKSIKIANEFAIVFAEWVGQNTINYSSGKFRMKTLKPTLFTSKELLEIYKKEKGL
jgi:hypothetical protein